MIYYNDEEMQDFQRKYEQYNEEIIKSIEEINMEFENVYEILETPKSKKEVPQIISYMHEALEIRRDEENNYMDNLNYIMNNYNDKINSIDLMIGDENV